LISKGIISSKILIKHFGENVPLANNDTENGRKQNRRVEIIAKYTYSNNVALNPFSSQESTLKRNSQYFEVPANKDISVKGKYGTILNFDKNSFIDQNGKLIFGNILIQLVEIYSKKDMIDNGLQTISDDKLLETSGMVYISVTYQNSKVLLKDNDFYKIQFPTKNKLKDMNLFYGNKLEKSINWELTDKILSDFTPSENRKALDKYIFNGSKLGWINCDRFVDITNKTDLIVTLADTVGVKLCLVFKNLNSIMDISKKKNTFLFSNIPIGEVATIVGFKKYGNNILYSSKIITIEKDKKETLTLEVISPLIFQEKIKELN
jgi:hypothetical protein